jgi:hypothetical protein
MFSLTANFYWVANLGESSASIVEQSAQGAEFISAAMDQLWVDVIGGGLYVSIANLGILFAVGTLIIWVVQTFGALLYQEDWRGFDQIIWPIVIVILLSNQAAVLATSTLQLRSILNGVNQSLLEQTSASIRLSEAYQQVMEESAAEDAVRAILSQCSGLADPQQQRQCFQQKVEQAEEVASQVEQPTGLLDRIIDSTFGPEAVAFMNTNIFQISVKGLLISLSIAFQWIVEISWLLTALLGPLAVGGSLLPVGQKAIWAWLAGFFSVAMVKLSFNIISGLVATLIVKAEQNDPLIFAFAVGLLSPILAVVLASGAGLAVFNSLSSLAKFGLEYFLPLKKS